MACSIGCADIIGKEEKRLQGCKKHPNGLSEGWLEIGRLDWFLSGKCQGKDTNKKKTLEVKVKPSRPPQARAWRISSVTGWKCFFHVSSRTITRGHQLKVRWLFIQLTSCVFILFFRPKLRPSAYSSSHRNKNCGKRPHSMSKLLAMNVLKLPVTSFLSGSNILFSSLFDVYPRTALKNPVTLFKYAYKGRATTISKH